MWGGDACVAPVLFTQKHRPCPRGRRKRPYETNPLPCSFHNIPTRESSTQLPARPYV